MRSYFLALSCCAGFSNLAATPTAPALVYSTYLRDSFTPTAIATDAAGNIYLAGSALVDPGSYQTTGLVVKLNPQGTQYLYVRYWGGSVKDMVNAMAVDGAGNVYIVGDTLSPDFPVTAGADLGTAPGNGVQRAFITKFDPNGVVVYSGLLGGSTYLNAQAVAITSAGQAIVSGPTPFLLELDPTGTKIVFSRSDIGGTALALDSAGNIYMAGSTNQLNYPVTPGSYQTTFPVVQGCYSAVCEFVEQGANQYVTKVDPTGSTLVYSTALTGTGNTSNGGLAVDAAGSAYVTGYAGAGYPYTAAPPAITATTLSTIPSLPFLSKLDPAGATLLFSVPVGGNGVQVDSNGNVYVGGRFGATSGLVGSYAITANLPALANVPTQCLPTGNANLQNVAYAAQADAGTGNVTGTQFIGGATIVPASVALVGSALWVAGATGDPDVPYTPDALTLPLWLSTPGAGAYVGAVDFAQPAPPSQSQAAGSPQIGCILDAADFSSSGPESRYQLLSIFGSGLGPGAGIEFTTLPAIVLYDSPTQINFAVPVVEGSQSLAAMQLTVNTLQAQPRAFPINDGNPHVFSNLVRNADGSANSQANPAAVGSAVSIFVNGVAQDPQVTNGPFDFSAEYGWTITNVTQPNAYVVQIQAQVPPASLVGEAPNSGCTGALCAEGITVFDGAGTFSSGPVYITK